MMSHTGNLSRIVVMYDDEMMRSVLDDEDYEAWLSAKAAYMRERDEA
jgi:hypothetical protein